MHGFAFKFLENGNLKLLVEPKRVWFLAFLTFLIFSLFLKKTWFLLLKTVEKIDIFDQVQAKMTFQNSLPFWPFLQGKYFLTKTKIDFRGQFWCKNGFLGSISLGSDYIFLNRSKLEKLKFQNLWKIGGFRKKWSLQISH